MLNMHLAHVQNLDLNLLKSLYALLETASVSEAAKKMNLSQPAMSRALNRLQHALHDPLLVRSGRGMVLTPRAEDLRAPVQDALAQLSSVFETQTFDPGTAEANFSIMAFDYLALIVLPRVLPRILLQAPKIKIEILHTSKNNIEELANGRVSLGIGVAEPEQELDGAVSQTLLKDDLVCLLRKGHPLHINGMSLEGYASQNHAMLNITGKGGSKIDRMLRKNGLSRNVVFRTPHFLSINAVILPTDLVITVPRGLAEYMVTDELVIMELPEVLRSPPNSIAQMWHRRFSHDPAHRWLRQIIKEAFVD